LESADALLLVDSRDTSEVAAFDTVVRSISARPVRMVINTHYHVDHVGSNPRFAQHGATIIAHQRMPVLARLDTIIPEMGNWRLKPIAAHGIPRRTFTDTLAMRFGGRRITLLHPPGAHTGGDAVIWFRDADVLHVGDIVEIGAPPFIDWWSGGSLDGMIAACDRIIALAGPATRIVPGHGPVVDREGVREYRDMLATIRGRVATALDSGRTRDQLLATQPTREFDRQLGGQNRGQGFTRLVWFGLARARNR
ncbi:MAG: MBL fold metallo-hydrolase, partial [Gammaproteobacteria bacterium]